VVSAVSTVCWVYLFRAQSVWNLHRGAELMAKAVYPGEARTAERMA
jgi:hypothetical protein